MATAAAIEADWDLVAALAADLHDAHGRLVRLVERVLIEGSWQASGIRSPEHWLMVRAGLSRGQARAIVLIARRAGELPLTSAALHDGRLSLDQAAVVARHTPPEFDATVAEFATHATVTQLHRTVSRYDFTLEPETFDAEGEVQPCEQAESRRPPVAPPSLSMGNDEDGRFRLRYDAPPEIGALVEAALREARDHLFHTAGSSEDTTPALLVDEAAGGHPRVTWADALTLMAERSLAGGATPGRRSRYRVHVFLDTDGGWLTGTPRLPRGIVDGLTCDGNLTPVWTTEGRPVNVGRSQRVVPHRTKVLVDDRDRGCRFPGCGSTAFVEVHHLVHWRDGGATDLSNLLSLCPFHHDAHHRGEFTVAGDPTAPEGLEFTTRLGRPIGPMRRTAHTGSRAEPTGSGGQVRPSLSTGPPVRPAARPVAGAPPSRPRPRLGRRYAAPTGGVLHLGLVDFTPPRHHPLRT